MSTGQGIVIATCIYCAVWLVLYWIECKSPEVNDKRPAATEARLQRMENFIRECGMDL